MLSLPWYTYAALSLVVIFWVGCWITVAGFFVRGLRSVFYASSTWFTLLFSWLFGQQLWSAGTAHWAMKREMKASGVFNETGLPLGTWKNGQTIREPRGSHVAIVAPPRSRKSWGVIMPVLRQYRGSAIITDLRGELHQHTHEAREAYGRVFFFNPAAPESCTLNVLDAVRWHSPYTYGDVDRMVHHILAPTGNNIGDEFRQNGIPLLRSIIFDRAEVGEGNFPAVVEWMNSPGRTLNEKLESLLHDSDDPHVQHGARRTLDMSPKLRQGVWNSVHEALGIFEDPIIADHTRHSDCHLADLLDGLEPLTIYLTMSFHEIARLGRYLGLFIEAIVSLVSAPHAPARHPLLLCLDEMANLGKLLGLEKAMSYLQGSGAQCLLVFQNVNQIIDTYGPTSPLLSSVSTTIFYTPVSTDLATATLISRALGQTTISAVSIQDSANGQSQTQSERGRALMTPDEVTRLPKSDAIILTQEHPPIYALKLGQIPPAWYVRGCLTLERQPMLASSLGMVLLMAFCLWPLTQYASKTSPVVAASMSPRGWSAPVTPALANSTPAASSTTPAETTPSPWTLRSSSPTLMNLTGRTMVHARYPDEATCQADLGKRYDALLTQVEKNHHQYPQMGKLDVVREPNRRKWTITLPGKTTPEIHDQWCTNEAGE